MDYIIIVCFIWVMQIQGELILIFELSQCAT